MCILRGDPGKPVIIILSKEGTLLGNVFGAANYAIAMLPLAEKIRATILQVLQPWSTDDLQSRGAAEENIACLKYLCTHGPRYEYLPNPDKSWYICKDVDEARAQEAFDQRNLTIQMIHKKI